MNDDRLTALLRDGAPPARDPLFEIAVMARIERQRFRKELMLNLALAVAAAALLALAAPPLEDLWRLTSVPHIGDMAVAVLLMAATYAGLRYYAARD